MSDSSLICIYSWNNFLLGLETVNLNNVLVTAIYMLSDAFPLQPSEVKSGTMMGVFIPCLQNILGIIYYIRFTWYNSHSLMLILAFATLVFKSIYLSLSIEHLLCFLSMILHENLREKLMEFLSSNFEIIKIHLIDS